MKKTLLLSLLIILLASIGVALNPVKAAAPAIDACEVTREEKDLSPGYTTYEESLRYNLSEERLEVKKVASAVKDGTTWYYLECLDQWGFISGYYAVHGEVSTDIAFVQPGDILTARVMENQQIMTCQIVE